MKILNITMGLMLFFCGSCKYAVEMKQFDELEMKKNLVVSIGGQELNFKNQEILRDYFLNVKELVYRFKTDKKWRQAIAKEFNRYFVASICSKGLLPALDYQVIIKSCKISSFFICAEEVRRYTEILKSVIHQLSASEMQGVLADQNCTNILHDLEVIE